MASTLASPRSIERVERASAFLTEAAPAKASEDGESAAADKPADEKAKPEAEASGDEKKNDKPADQGAG